MRLGVSSRKLLVMVRSAGVLIVLFGFFSRAIDIKGVMNLLFMEMQMLNRRLKERQCQ